MKNDLREGNTRSLEWLTKNLPPKRKLTPVEFADLEIEIGGIYRAVTPDSYQLDSPLSGSRMIVLVTRIHAEHIEICLLHEDEDWMTDKDIFLDFDDSGSIHHLVLQTDMVGVIWHYQLQHPDGSGCMRLGKIDEKILDSIKSVREGNCPDSLIHKIGLRLQRSDTSLWKFKENQVDEINFLSADCTQALLAGEGYFDKFVNKDLKAELYETVGRKPIITTKAELKTDRHSSIHIDFITEYLHPGTGSVPRKSERIAYVDPAVLDYDREYYAVPENLMEVVRILRVAQLHPSVEFSRIQNFLDKIPKKSYQKVLDVAVRAPNCKPELFSAMPFNQLIESESTDAKELIDVQSK